MNGVVHRYLAKWQAACSRREVCEAQVRKKLSLAKDLAGADIDEILESLKRDRFIDDMRFAEAYIKDKTGLSGWGLKKIEANLRKFGIDQSVVGAAVGNYLKNDGGSKQLALLEKLAQKKWLALKSGKEEPDGNDTQMLFKLRAKLLRYLVSNGFDYNLSFDLVSRFR